jgi:hypothetical protein
VGAPPSQSERSSPLSIGSLCDVVMSKKPIAAPIFTTGRRTAPGRSGRVEDAAAEEDSQPLSTAEAQAKIDKFQRFVDEKLKVDLKRVLDDRDKVYTRIAQ